MRGELFLDSGMALAWVLFEHLAQVGEEGVLAGEAHLDTQVAGRGIAAGRAVCTQGVGSIYGRHACFARR